MHSGGVLGRQVGTWKSNCKKQPSATKSHNITRIQVKSWILQGFWEISLKLEKVSKNSDSLQDHVKSQESK